MDRQKMLDDRGRISRRVAMNIGMVIDDHCYPPFAYLGERFASEVGFPTYSALEQELLEDRNFLLGGDGVENLVLTDAPDSYDWSGVRVLVEEWGRHNRKAGSRQIRLVWINDNIRAQMDRYGSGLYLAITLGSESFDELDFASTIEQKNPVTGRYES